MKKHKGFTLIELLIVIGIIAILAAIIYVAVDPARRLAEARNAERWSSVNAILNATLKYTVDNAGSLPTKLDGVTGGVYYVIGEGGPGNCADCGAVSENGDCLDLNNGGELVDTYLASMPLDPSDDPGSVDDTGYYIMISDAGRITVGACDPEEIGDDTPTIAVSR